MQSRIPVASMSTVTILVTVKFTVQTSPIPLVPFLVIVFNNISFKSWVSIIDDVVDTEPGYREYTHVCRCLRQFCLFFSWNGKLKITYIKLKDFEVTSEKSCLLYTGVLVVRTWWLLCAHICLLLSRVTWTLVLVCRNPFLLWIYCCSVSSLAVTFYKLPLL